MALISWRKHSCIFGPQLWWRFCHVQLQPPFYGYLGIRNTPQSAFKLLLDTAAGIYVQYKHERSANA